MNSFSIHSLGLSFVLIAGLTACNSSAPPDAAATAPAASAEPASAPADTGEAEAAATAIPDTADGIWQAINQQSSELKATIASGDLKNVHHQAFAIRDLVAALPAHSPALPAEDQAKLQGEIKFVATLADRLDETGDAGDRAGALADYDKLVAVLDGITRYK